MRGLILIALLAAFTGLASAQQVISPSPLFAPAHPARGSIGVPGQNHVFHHHHSGFYPPFFYSDLFYPDLFDSAYERPASEPPVIVVQAAPTPATPQPIATSAQPLLIELQGGRYVRVSGEVDSAETINLPAPPGKHPSRSKTAVSFPEAMEEPASHTLPPVALVFRDGHREEVTGYTIVNGILYARADFYSEGSWTRQIDLKSLDVPATIQANQTRGVQFRLPNLPNEVTVGP